MVAALCFLIALQIQAPPPRAPARDAVAEKKGASAIRGKVVSLEGERPLRRARVSLSSPELSEPQTTSTDAFGAYEFAQLPAGRYTIGVSRSGYLSLQYGQLRPGEPGKPLQLGDAQTLDRVDFALPRAGTISGRITDESGDPFPGVAVYAAQLQYFRGRRRLVPVSGGFGGGNRTDDLGQYRIVGLAPGEYAVMATTREMWSADEDQKEVFGYAQTYLPGVANATDAQRIKIGVGQDAAGADFSMAPMRAVTVSGTAFRSDGTPMVAATVMVSYELSGPAFASMGVGPTAKVAADGSWSVRDVSPGDYQARVSSIDRDRPPESAIALITVQGADVDGVALAADPGATLAGRVTTDDGSPLPAQRLTVSARVLGAERMPLGGVTGVPENNGIVGPDGAFTYRAASGPLAIRVSSLPRGWAVKHIVANGQDHAQSALEVRGTQRLDDLSIVITRAFPDLTGRIVGDGGKAVDGTVILFSTDSSKWIETLGVTRSARPDQAGAFRFDSVRPGEYLLVALEYVQQWQVNDPEFLEEQRRRAVKVTVGNTMGEPVELKLLR